VIVVSLVLLAVAGVLLVVGILQGNTDAGTALLVASIATTLGAAALLYLGVRPRSVVRDTATDPGDAGEPVDRRTPAGRAVPPRGEPAARTQVLPAVAAPPAASSPAASPPADRLADEDPPDEPAIEAAAAADLDRIGGRDDEVVVVDGRPRYHLAGCAHLTGRESEGLPVSEAAELGFTPCMRCAPIATLLTVRGR
jgi:hypothetical protein